MKNLKDEIDKVLIEYGRVVEDVGISGVVNPVGYKQTHKIKPAHDDAVESLTSLIEQEKERAVREFVNYIIVRETPVGAVTVNDKLRFLIDGLGQYLAERKEQFLKESEGK